MSSTDYYRTIQSGYSELLGLIGQNQKFNFFQDMEQNRNFVPFKVRKNVDFGILKNSFIGVPIYT